MMLDKNFLGIHPSRECVASVYENGCVTIEKVYEVYSIIDSVVEELDPDCSLKKYKTFIQKVYSTLLQDCEMQITGMDYETLYEHVKAAIYKNVADIMVQKYIYILEDRTVEFYAFDEFVLN